MKAKDNKTLKDLKPSQGFYSGEGPEPEAASDRDNWENDDGIRNEGLLNAGFISHYLIAEKDFDEFSEETYRRGKVLFLSSFALFGLSLLILCMLMKI